MRSSTSIIVLAAFASLSFACSSSSHDVDPTSREALTVAPPLAYGCKYTQESSDYLDGELIGSDSQDKCSGGLHCSEIGAPTDIGGSAAGSTYRTSSYYAGKTEFIGTCAAPQPIACDEYKDGDACDACVGKSCCAPAFLCEHDPNCKAIVDCVTSCKSDSACTKRCIENGESSASENLQALVQCMTGACSSACGN